MQDKSINDSHHQKTDLKVFNGVVIPKEGWPSFFGYKSKDSNSKKSVSYQKKDGRGHVRPSFFWYNDDKDLKVCFLVM